MMGQETDHFLAANEVFNIGSMSKTEILGELSKPTKIERQEIRLRLAELDSEDWLDDEDPLTVHEKALLEAPHRLREGSRRRLEPGKKLRDESEFAFPASETDEPASNRHIVRRVIVVLPWPTQHDACI
jgi:hypothetical protein